MSSVVVTAVFHPLPERAGELAAALTASIPAVHEEEGCQLYAIHDAEDGTITMIEKWTSAEALQAHAEGAAVVALNSRIKDLVAQPTVVTRMTPIPAGSEEQGRL